MNTGFLLELGVILLLLLVNAIFAMSEIAVVTARRIRLEQRAERGDKGAAAAIALAEDPTQFLATVQVGITLVGVLAGAFGGATLAEDVAPLLARIAWLAPYADTLSFLVVVGGITYLSLIVGELVPKRVALVAPERIASFVARPMRAISRTTAPLVKVLTGSTNFMLRVLGVRPHAEQGLTEEEIRAMLEQSAERGVLEPEEQELVESVFRLGDRTVRSIMTPRPEVEWIDLHDRDPEANARLDRLLREERHPLLLVCEEDLDHPLGFVHAEDLLARCMAGDTVDRSAIREAVREPLFVPSSMRVLRLVEAFRSSRQHAAVVLDEYGGVSGTVTLHEVTEALFGDLPTASEVAEPSIVRREDGSWLVEGAMSVPDLEAELDLSLRDEEHADYQTLAGFVLARLGRLPHAGDHFEWRGHRFEVLDMDGRRVDKVLIAPLAPSSAARLDAPDDERQRGA